MEERPDQLQYGITLGTASGLPDNMENRELVVVAMHTTSNVARSQVVKSSHTKTTWRTNVSLYVDYGVDMLRNPRGDGTLEPPSIALIILHSPKRPQVIGVAEIPLSDFPEAGSSAIPKEYKVKAYESSPSSCESCETACELCGSSFFFRETGATITVTLWKRSSPAAAGSSRRMGSEEFVQRTTLAANLVTIGGAAIKVAQAVAGLPAS